MQALAAADPMARLRILAAIIVAVLVIAEMTYRTLAHHRPPSPRTTATNGIIFTVDLVLRGLSLAVRLALFTWVASLSPWQLPITWWSVLGTYLLIDFIYYWKHRLFHVTKLGWALHRTHHSSTELNFLATFRLNWIEAMAAYLFFLPLALLGFPPLLLFTLVEINDGWQFLCHTELVFPFKKLGKVFNNPNYHRVHHALDRNLANCNYTSTLTLWDRLFGTYHPGLDRVEYGVQGGERLTNVLAIQFRGLLDLFAGRSTTTPPRTPDSKPAPS